MADNFQLPSSDPFTSDAPPWPETSRPQTDRQLYADGFSSPYTGFGKRRHAPTAPILDEDILPPVVEKPQPAVKKFDISSQPARVNKAGQPPSALLNITEPTEITIPAGSKLVAAVPVKGHPNVYMLGVENGSGVQTRYFINTAAIQASKITVKGVSADGSTLGVDLLNLADTYAGAPTKGHWPPGTPGKSGQPFSDADYAVKQQERAEDYRTLITPQPVLRQNQVVVPQQAASAHTGPHRTMCQRAPATVVPQPACQPMPLTRRAMRRQFRHGCNGF